MEFVIVTYFTYDLNHQKSYKICDNGCGTTCCSSCNKSYHIVNNVFVKGHSKTCGKPATRKYEL